MKLGFRGLASFLSLAGVTVGCLAGAAHADELTPYEKNLVCKLGGTCDGGPGTEPAPVAQSRTVGDEATFVVFRGDETPKAPAKAAAPTASTPRYAATPKASTSTSPSRGATGGTPRYATVATATPDLAARAGAADAQVFFENDSATLSAASRDEIASFARALQEKSIAGNKYVVEGHTNAVGSADYNLDLSRRRAQAVVEYLETLGVSATRLEAKGFGFSKPRVSGNPADGRNRRVEIVKVP